MKRILTWCGLRFQFKSGRESRLFLAIALASFLLGPVRTGAQTANTGAVTGTVRDSSGSAIPGAKVELREPATNRVREQTTNQAGGYTFASVPPGLYRIAASMSGFRSAVASSVEVQVAKSFALDFALEVGQLEQSVEVVAEKMELQTADATVGNVLASESLLRLPSLRRDASEFLTLQPGTIPEGGFGERGGGAAGARSDQNTLTLDGVDITDNIFGGGSAVGGAAGFRTVVPVPVESLEEYRVGVSNPNASFGR